MTFPPPESAPVPAARIPSVVVLGADAILAALPATPVQLAHACLHAGYHSVLPASWGDELIAGATLKCLERRGGTPAIQCSCPLVANRLLAAGTDLRPFLVSLVSPPVALARYLRSAYAPAKVRITYVGRCPSASDESIDARLTPEELLAMLVDRHVVLEEQPRVFDSVLPPDRRRFKSQPGGLPTSESLFAEGGGRHLVELDGHDLSIELAQHLLGGKAQLIDAASSLGCVCSGARFDAETNGARARIAALEPPRSLGPVIDDRVPVELELSLPASPRNAIDILPMPGTPLSPTLRAMPLDDALVDAERSIESVNGLTPVVSTPPAESESPSRGRPTQNPVRRNFSQSGRSTARPATATPTARDTDGRQLPRTYVSRLRAGRPAAPPVVATSAPVPQPVALGDELTATSRLATAADVQSSAGTLSPVTQFPALPRADRTLIPERNSSAPLASSAILPSHGLPTPSVSNGTSPSPRPASTSDGSRVYERAIDLTVTRQSDGPRERASGAASVLETRPLRQLLMFALLVATIVLTSAALGVVVGRWLTQR
jgi:Iron only hydrogenase large subunit, C-terminal domain